MMRIRTIRLFFVVLIVVMTTVLPAACGKSDTKQEATTQAVSTEQPTQTKKQSANEMTEPQKNTKENTAQRQSDQESDTKLSGQSAEAISGSLRSKLQGNEKQQTTQHAQNGVYWKTAGFDGLETESGELWSDLFLWEDGTGYFRYSQATPSGGYYGIHDVTDCDWTIASDGTLTLFRSGTKTVLYAGSVSGNVLTLNYDECASEPIKMGRAKMPPFGSHWTVLNLYGTWRMTGRTMAGNSHQTMSYYTQGGMTGYFSSELTLDRVIGAHFWLAYPLDEKQEIIRNLNIGHQNQDGTWLPIKEGPIWDGCVNEAWHVELSGNSDPAVRFYVAYANGQLFLRKDDLKNPSESFTAEFEYVGDNYDMAEQAYQHNKTSDFVDVRYAEVAYSVILDLLRSTLQFDWTPENTADFITACLENEAHITDETALNALNSALFEPLQYSAGEFGYAIRDINEDGFPELFILVRDDYSEGDTVIAIFTIHENKTVLVDAFWSRKRCTVDMDGTIYINGSSGWDNSSSESYQLNAGTGRLQLIRTFDESYEPQITAAEAGLFLTPFSGGSTQVTQTTPTSPATSPQAGNDNRVNDSEQVHIFSSIAGYDGKVYSIYAAPEIPNFIGIKGSTKFTPLPDGITRYLESEGEGLYVYNFTIYQNRIYYLAAEPGSIATPGIVYRCNMDGTQNEAVDYVTSASTCMIFDGWLYSDGETEGGYIITTAKKLDNLLVPYERDFPEEIDPGIVHHQGFLYYFSEGTLYKKDLQTESTTVITMLTTGSTNLYGSGSVIAVVGETVYYATNGDYSDNGSGGNTYLYGVSIHGGTGDLLATWFTA